MKLLENELGNELFDQLMQEYYSTLAIQTSIP